MTRPVRTLVSLLLLATFASAALASSPPRRPQPTRGSGPPAARSECAYQVQIADFRIVKLDQVRGVELKGYNAPIRFDITLKNIGTGTYSPGFGHGLELALGARELQATGVGKLIRKSAVRELEPGQQIRIHWTYDYNTRDARLPTHEAQFQAAIWNACNPSYPWVSRVYPRTIPVYQWALDAYRKANQGEATRF